MFSDFSEVVILLMGLALRYLVGQRRFKRRNVAGLQRFRSFAQAIFITALEWLVNAAGLVMIVAGIILLLI
jgi:hypothetical protein